MIEFGNEENGTLILSTTTISYQISPLKAHFKRIWEKRKSKSKTI